MRCDIIAEGIIAAARELELSIPIVVRLQGKQYQLMNLYTAMYLVYYIELTLSLLIGQRRTIIFRNQRL